MNRINRNGRLIEFDRIVAYGCSFTAGAELIDHEVFSHLGGVEAVDALKRKHKNYAEFMNETTELCKGHIHEKWLHSDTSLNWDVINEEQRKFSYVNRLADKLGVPCDNRAESGSSVEYVSYQLALDISNGDISSNDLVIIGVTNPGRHFYIDSNDHHRHLLPGYPSFNWKSDEFHDQFVEVFCSKSNVVWNYYKSIHYIEMLNNTTYNNILCLPVFENNDYFEDTCYFMPDKNTSVGERLFNLVKGARDFNVLVRHGFNKVVNVFERDKMHGFHHPTIEHHQMYTDYLYEILK